MSLLNLCSYLKKRNNNSLYNDYGYFDTYNLLINLDIRDSHDRYDSFRDYVTAYHENIHWFQQTSSTIGYFFNLIIQVEHSIIYSFIDKIEIELPLIDYLIEKKEIINEQISLEPEIFGFPTSYNIDYVEYYIHKLSSLEYLIYLFEGNFTESQYKEMDLYLRARTINELIYFSCKDTLWLYENLGIYNNQNHLFLETVYKYLEKNRHIEFIGLEDGTCLGVKHILEGHARVNDYLLLDLLYIEHPSDDIYLKIKKDLTSNGLYASAYKIFCEYVVLEDELYSQILFAAVCDYALNPVLPPLFDHEQLYSSILEPRFSLPQFRFMNIIETLKLVIDKKIITFDSLFDKFGIQNIGGFLFRNLSIENLNAFIYEIYDIIAQYSLLENPIKIARMIIDKKLPSENTEKVHYDSIHFCTKQLSKFSEIRLECPAFLVVPNIVLHLDKALYKKYEKIIGIPIMVVSDSARKTGANTDFSSFNRKIYSDHFIKQLLYNDSIDANFYDKASGLPDCDLQEIINYFQNFCKTDISKYFK